MTEKAVVKSVGLVIFTEVPGMGLVAVLRERGWFNFETMKPESWPGGCQVTVHGGLRENEDFMEGLYREIAEELGPEFAQFIFTGDLLLAHHDEQKGKEVKTFIKKIDISQLALIRLNPESGSIRFLRQEDLGSVLNMTAFSKEAGPFKRETIAMFPDEISTVAFAFRILK